jgi:hypothetical protein
VRGGVKVVAGLAMRNAFCGLMFLTASGTAQTVEGAIIGSLSGNGIAAVHVFLVPVSGPRAPVQIAQNHTPQTPVQPAVSQFDVAQDEPDWQKAAGGKMAFEVASVRATKIPSPDRPPTFPLDNRDAYVPGGRFFASFSLWSFISFAYKLSSNDKSRADIEQLPKWVTTSSLRRERKAILPRTRCA